MSSLTVNDILDELFDENRRILNELLFANKVVIKSLEFKDFIDSIAKEFVDNLSSDVKKKYEELSRGLNLLMNRKCANISNESPNEWKTVTLPKSETSDQPIERDNDCHTTNEGNITQVEEYLSEESVDLDVIRPSETKNYRMKYFCNRCGNTYDFPEELELHFQDCRPKRQSLSSESNPEYNLSEIEKENGEKEMVSEDLVHENVVTRDKCDNNEGSYAEEPLGEELLVEKSVTDKPSVRTENICHKPMTRSLAKVVSEQQPTQSSGGLNLSSKPSAKQKSKPNSRAKTKLFLYKCGFTGCSAIFSKRQTMFAHKKLHQWKCDFPGCDFQNQYQYKLKYHMNSHSEDRPFQCHHCHKNYKNKSDLTHHVKDKHLDQCPNDPILVCDWSECQYRTKSMKGLNEHKRNHTLPFECHNCQQGFSSAYKLKIHLILKHKNNQ